MGFIWHMPFPFCLSLSSLPGKHKDTTTYSCHPAGMKNKGPCPGGQRGKKSPDPQWPTRGPAPALDRQPPNGFPTVVKPPWPAFYYLQLKAIQTNPGPVWAICLN